MPTSPPEERVVRVGARCAQPVTLSTRLPILAVLTIVLIGASLLRFTGLDREGRWGDEYHQTRSYDLPLTYPHYVVLAARDQRQPPADYLIGWLLAKVHRSDWMRRAPAAFFGVLGVALCFALTRRMFAPGEGIIAACLVALAPLHWALSREARPYTIATAAMLVMFLAMERALSEPTRRRLIIYAAAAYAFTLTRSLLSLVVLLAIGMALTLAWAIVRLREGQRQGILSHRDHRGLREKFGSFLFFSVASVFSVASPNPGSQGALRRQAALRPIRRVGMATLLVGLAAIPMFLFLASGDVYTVLSSSSAALGTVLGQPWPQRLAANLATWTTVPRDMFGDGFLIVITFVLLGLVRCWRERRALSPAGRLILGVMLLSGPLYLLVYSTAVTFHPINTRYALFLIPILSILAGVGFIGLVRGLRRIAPGYVGLRGLASSVALAVLLASPMHKTLSLTNHFFRPDWRGCAAYLETRVSPRDVIIVFQDRPLSRPQATFWGKHDWPASMARPLAEPAWSLVSSQSHWQRLTKQDGQVYLVIRRTVRAGPRDAYLARGLKEAPHGTTLTKFRGLDLLTLSAPADSAIDRMIQACDILISIPKKHADSDAIPLALRSRLELLAGQRPSAAESFDRARQLVPPRLSDWFSARLAVHVDALNGTAEVAAADR